MRRSLFSESENKNNIHDTIIEKKMSIKTIFALFVGVFMLFSCASLGQQSYASHKVQEGETVSSIASKYNITVYELYRLNPEARSKLYPGLVLVLPGNSKAPSGDKTASAKANFKVHTVQKGETLYSLSKMYGVTQESIKRYNTQLYASELRTGDAINIPIQKEAVADSEKPADTNRKHVVQPKETVFGVARMYGVSVAELQALNPDLPENLPIGTIINVPDKNYTDDAKVDESEYGFYEVQPQETLYSLTRRWDMSREELIELNPALKDGLKNGMVLKLPRSLTGLSTSSEEGGQRDLAQSITNFSVKNVALLLPFNATVKEVDSIDTNRELLKANSVTRLALDFYSGALMAVDSAKALGISTNLSVYDTEYRRGDDAGNTRRVDNILNNNDFTEVDAVVGPLLGSNVERASDDLKSRNIPVVSPITPRVVMGSNIFQSRPTDDLLRDFMLKYIDISGAEKNIVVIADAKSLEVKNRIMSIHPNAKFVEPKKSEDGYYLDPTDISSKLSNDQDNWVILETNNVPLISNTVTNLSTLTDRNVTLMTTRKGSAYDSDDLSNMTLMRLGFEFPSIDKQGAMDDTDNIFFTEYREKYGVDPSNYAVRGFDLTFDTLLRLASAEDLYASANSGVETNYVDNKFNYVRDEKAGFYNDAVFILKYGPDLILQEVKVPTQVIEKLENTIKD